MSELPLPPASPEPPLIGGEPAYGPTPRRRGWHALRMLWEWTRSMATALLLFFVVRSFFVEAFRIPSGSMEGTLLVGDFLLVNKLVFGAEVPFTNKRLPKVHQPRRGEVIVFQFPVDPSVDFVKRLVGVPGDTLSMVNGELRLNGTPQRERYVSHTEPGTDPAGQEFHWQREFLVSRALASASYHPSRNNWGPIVVPPARYFVLGDNRDNSLDSRYWGFVPDSLLRGQPILVYFSYEPDTTSAAAFLTHVRWGRLGTLVR
ncbi:MAG: signal peptidase I [Gemmatimonadetes bacterium]|nr:signal peptidase I [Gemmatimonadota bacterium]